MNKAIDTNLKANENKHYCTIETAAFDIYFIIMLVLKGLGFTSGNVYQAAVVLASLCLAFKALIGKYNSVQKAVLLSITMFAVVCWRSSNDMGTLFCISLVAAMKGIEKKHAFRLGAVVWTISFVVLTLSQLLNIGTRDFVIHSKFGLGYIIRWALGYSHPNVLQIAYTVLVFYWMYLVHPDDSRSLLYDKKTLLSIILSALGAVYIFLYSFSTTGFLMYFIYLFTLLYLENRRRAGAKRGKTEKLLMVSIFPACVLLSILGPVLLKGTAFDAINRLMNTRPALSRIYLTEYGVSLLGRDFSFLPARITLDCSYMYLLMHGGLILFLLFTVGYFLLIKWTVSQKSSWENSNEIAMLISFSFTAMSEPFAFNTSYKNVTLIFLGYYLYHISEHCGVGKAWVSGLQQIGERKVYILDMWELLIQFKEKLCHIARRYKVAVIGTGTIAAVIGMSIFLSNSRPLKQAVARRISCETDDAMESVYYTEKEINALREDPSTIVLNYKDEEDPMLLFDNSKMFLLEKIRGGVSSAIWIGTGAAIILCMAITFVERPKTKT